MIFNFLLYYLWKTPKFDTRAPLFQEIVELQRSLELQKDETHDQERKARDLLVKIDNLQSVDEVWTGSR